MKSKITILIIFVFGTWLQGTTQTPPLTYKNAIGITVWDGVGATYKHFLKENAALEAIAFFNSKGARTTGLYEFHFRLGNEPGLRWFVGPGAHLGFYNNTNGNGLFPGIDGIIGVEYIFNKIPLNAAINWQPTVEFGNDRGFNGSWGGLSARYIF